MKRLKIILLATSFLFVTMSQQGCIGPFQLTNKLYQWNKTEVGGKWGSELVFLAFVIIPVYSVALLADGIVLNTIEFWSGENPLSMKDGEKETQIVQKGDDTYKLTAEKNKVYVEKLSGDYSGEQGEFTWNEQTKNWSWIGEGQQFELEQ